MKKILHITLRISAICILFIILGAMALAGYEVINSRYYFNKDISSQADRIKELRLNSGERINEQDFVSFDLTTYNPSINKIQTLITHNSYKQKMPSVNFYGTQFIYNILNKNYEPQYAHNTLYDQLNNGIRGLELDIRLQDDNFYIYHAPIYDNRTSAPDWKLALEEILIWSNNNPNHIPITVLIEIKTDSSFLNPSYQETTLETLKLLDETISAVIPEEKILTPSFLMNDYNTLNEMVINDAWPDLFESAGKFMFLLHPNDVYTKLYIDNDSTMTSQIMIPLIEYEKMDLYSSQAAVIMYNEPDISIIQNLVNNHYLIRSRMDSGIEYDELRKQNALSSGAQLLSTDFEKNRLFPINDYIAYLEGSHTVRLNPLFYP